MPVHQMHHRCPRLRTPLILVHKLARVLEQVHRRWAPGQTVGPLEVKAQHRAHLRAMVCHCAVRRHQRAVPHALVLALERRVASLSQLVPQPPSPALARRSAAWLGPLLAPTAAYCWYARKPRCSRSCRVSGIVCRNCDRDTASSSTSNRFGRGSCRESWTGALPLAAFCNPRARAAPASLSRSASRCLRTARFGAGLTIRDAHSTPASWTVRCVNH
eukprot:1334064-Rhodomonas_salina.2